MIKGRPFSITVLCILLALASVLNLFSVGASIGAVSNGRFSWILFTNVVIAISIFGIWKLKAWGAALYFVGQVVGIAAFFLVPPDGADLYPMWAIFIVPALVAVPILIHWRSFGTANHSESISNA